MYTMRIVIFVFMNVILIFANNISWPKNHRFHENNQTLSLHSKEILKIKIKTNNEPTSKRLEKYRSIDNEDSKEEKGLNLWNLSKETDRIQFRIEGHEGPETYIFGFDTGLGKNRQYRLEERHPDGTIKGQYGYYDAKGKLRSVRYIARPFEGYTEKHHESNVPILRN